MRTWSSGRCWAMARRLRVGPGPRLGPFLSRILVPTQHPRRRRRRGAAWQRRRRAFGERGGERLPLPRPRGVREPPRASSRGPRTSWGDIASEAMSEHHRGAWGARGAAAEEAGAVWWPGALDYQHHQHLLQQQIAAHQQQQHDVAAAHQQLFSYKMAGAFPAAASAASSCVRGGGGAGSGGGGGGYDYGGGRSAAASLVGGAAAQWWYSSGMGPVHGGQGATPVVNQNRGRMPRGKAEAKPRGRMTAYAFFVQTCREEHKKKHPEENVIFAEFSKKCSERWKTMVDKEKKRFHEMAEKDKERYDTEMETYTPAKGEKGHGRKRKHNKDPNAPKRALSAFFWFCNDERSKVKAMHPDFGVGDIAKELGRRWSDVDAEQKGKYEAMAKKDKARYDRDMTAYKKRPKQSAAAPASKKQDSEEEDEEEEEEDVEEDDE